MSRLRLFAGLRSSTGGIALCEEGFTDDGQIYNMLAESERVFPGGIGGEAIFDVAYIVVTYNCRFRLLVGVIVDGETVLETMLDPGAAPAAEKTSRYEVPLKLSILDGLGRVVGKRSPRGGWIQFKVRTAFDAIYPAGAVRIDEMRVEGEVTQESLTPLAGAGA